MEDSEAIVINKYTGEVLCNNPVKWISKAQDEAKNKWKESNMKFQNDNFDSFIWFVYNPLEKIFPELNGAEIARLIVLATYIDYNDGYLFLNRSILSSIGIDFIDLLRASFLASRNVFPCA